MIFGLKNIACEVIYLPNNDEETPTQLIGKKMLPVLVSENHEPMGESLDIVQFIDENYGSPVLTLPENVAIEAWMEDATKVIYLLAIPRWASSDFEEFRHYEARKYFVSKKEAFFGSFPHLLDQSEKLIAEINLKLEGLEFLLSQQEMDTEHFSLTDIRLFPLLRSLSIVKGIHWPNLVDAWRKEMSAWSRVNLNDDIAI